MFIGTHYILLTMQGEDEMLGYWINDLPLPSTSNQYRWAKDPALLVNISLIYIIYENIYLGVKDVR